MVQGGYLAAGYEYIIIDDCWLNHTRAPVMIIEIGNK